MLKNDFKAIFNPDNQLYFHKEKRADKITNCTKELTYITEITIRQFNSTVHIKPNLKLDTY